jgi:hypothetical protein
MRDRVAPGKVEHLALGEREQLADLLRREQAVRLAHAAGLPRARGDCVTRRGRRRAGGIVPATGA